MTQIEDKTISEALLLGTEEAIALKAEVWKNIQSELNFEEKKKMKSKRNHRFSGIKYGSIAAAVMVVVFFNITYGHAAISKIKQIFAPTKVVKQQVEGMSEEKKVDLKEGSSQYILYIDQERYTMIQRNGIDKIIPKIKAEKLPEVFMEITQVKHKAPKEKMAEVEKMLKNKYKTVKNMGKINEPLTSYLLYASGGSNWNDTVEKYYFVDNHKGGTFVIRQQFFMEATEGHGVRFGEMLKEFKILE